MIRNGRQRGVNLVKGWRESHDGYQDVWDGVVYGPSGVLKASVLDITVSVGLGSSLLECSVAKR